MLRRILTCLCLSVFPGTVRASLVTVINPQARPVSSQTVTGGTQISLVDLQAILSNRADRTTAGVFDSENVSAAGSLPAAEPDYALAKFTLTGSTRYGRNDASAAAVAPSSGGRFGFVNGSETWTLGTRVGEGVTHFGAMFSNWGTGALLTSVTATFSDGSTSVFTSSALAGEYAFAGFQAPEGLTISSVRVVEASTGNWLGFDDVALVLEGSNDPPPPPLEITDFTVDPVTGFHTVGWPSVLGRTYRVEYTTDNSTWQTAETGWDAQGDGTLYIYSTPPAAAVLKYRIITE